MKTLIVNLFMLATALNLWAEPKTTKAQAGKMLEQGRSLIEQGQPEQALELYRQMAKDGDMDGSFAAGKLLLGMAEKTEGIERLQKSHEAVMFLFCAATNRHAAACAQLSHACLTGTGGLRMDPVKAYAWLNLAAQFSPGFKPELDQMVVNLEPQAVTQAQNLSAQWLQGAWPEDEFKPVEAGDARLKVQGKSVHQNRQLVILNGSTFAPGDTDDIKPASGRNNPHENRLTITCLEIGNDYVLVAIAGERSLKLLPAGAD